MESWQSKQLVYTTNITKRITTQQRRQKVRGQSLPRSVSFRSDQREEGIENIYRDEEGEESVSDREKFRNAIEDLPLIGEQTSGRRQQQQQQLMPLVVEHNNNESNNQIEERKNYYHHNNEKQQNQKQNQSSQYYDINNNGFNSSKVRLLITPAAGALPEVCGSKQQQQAMAFSTQNIINSQANYNNNRSQQQQSRQKNYHHYDYYTDSELTSSQKEVQQRQQLNHYDNEENILLFATEHDSSNNSSNAGKSSNNINNNNNNNGNQQRARVAPEKLHQQQQQVPPVCNLTRAKSTSHQYSSLLYNYNAPPQTGKFVNYYPSWRQTQSPTSHYQNYSFHVPLNQQQQQYSYLQQPLYQPRYSFVAPVERIYVTPGGRFKQSFKSQTISHIPNMIKVSVGETTGGQKAFMSPTKDNNNSFEDYYDKPSGVVDTTSDDVVDNNNKYLMKSEGDLLKAHVVDLGYDKGYDNPFKPGTELSWEAEMMVRLMKRGYPIQELPVLVETAKHLAKERTNREIEMTQYNDSLSNKTNTSSAKQRVKSDEIILNQQGNKNKLINNQQSTLSSSSSSSPLMTTTTTGSTTIKRGSNQKSENAKLRRQLSQSDLSSGKQVWANSLSRTKSMPRFSNYYLNKQNLEREDIDSIDKLIISIENEMADLLCDGSGEEEEQDDSKRLIREIGNNQNKRNLSKVPRGKKLQSERRNNNDTENGGSNATNIKVNNRQRQLETNKSNNNNKTVKKQESDLTRFEKSKNKKNEKACCVIQ